MAIGERIRYFRRKNHLTQKQLGQLLGFDENQADVRIAQYETGSRKPKEKYVQAFADIFHVCPQALTVPNIDSPDSLIHTLFALEDIYGLRASKKNGDVCLCLDPINNDFDQTLTLQRFFRSWQEQAVKLDTGEITQGEYDQWRYRFPEV